VGLAFYSAEFVPLHFVLCGLFCRNFDTATSLLQPFWARGCSLDLRYARSCHSGRQGSRATHLRQEIWNRQTRRTARHSFARPSMFFFPVVVLWRHSMAVSSRLQRPQRFSRPLPHFGFHAVSQLARMVEFLPHFLRPALMSGHHPLNKFRQRFG